MPSTLEFIDADSLAAVARHLERALGPAGTGALLLLEVDGLPGGGGRSAAGRAGLPRRGRPVGPPRDHEDARQHCGGAPRVALRAEGLAPRKINHDVSVPQGRVPQLFALMAQLECDAACGFQALATSATGTSTSTSCSTLTMPRMARARDAAHALFEGVVALEGSISGEHGIGFAKLPFLPLELEPDVIALMQRVKSAFDPHGILNPGKIWEGE